MGLALSLRAPPGVVAALWLSRPFLEEVEEQDPAILHLAMLLVERVKYSNDLLSQGRRGVRTAPPNLQQVSRLLRLHQLGRLK